MIQKILNLLIILIILVISGLINQNYPNIDLAKITSSLTAIAILYAFFQLILINLIIHRIPGRKTKFLVIRLTNALYYAVTSLWVLTIWIENTETLLLSYGLVSAALAFALQDLFKNIVGGISLLISGIYHVGDRVQIDNDFGDIIAIDLVNTTMFEIKNWVDGDQPTGRIINIPNQKIPYASIANYSKDHNFIWDEIMIPLTYESDWKQAGQIMSDIIQQETAEIIQEADQEMDKLSKKYFFEETPTKSDIFITPTENWITMRARYITRVKDRRVIKNNITKAIIEQLQKKRKIKIASQTLRLVK